MSSSAIKPTWAPFHSTVASEQKLLFSLRLMSGGFGDGVLWGGWASTTTVAQLVLVSPWGVQVGHGCGVLGALA